MDLFTANYFCPKKKVLTSSPFEANTCWWQNFLCLHERISKTEVWDIHVCWHIGKTGGWGEAKIDKLTHRRYTHGDTVGCVTDCTTWSDNWFQGSLLNG